jgi:hypothetical protein
MIAIKYYGIGIIFLKVKRFGTTRGSKKVPGIL